MWFIGGSDEHALCIRLALSLQTEKRYSERKSDYSERKFWYSERKFDYSESNGAVASEQSHFNLKVLIRKPGHFRPGFLINLSNKGYGVTLSNEAHWIGLQRRHFRVWTYSVPIEFPLSICVNVSAPSAHTGIKRASCRKSPNVRQQHNAIQANIRQNRTRNASQKRAVTLKKVAPYGASQKFEVCWRFSFVWKIYHSLFWSAEWLFDK